MNLGSARRMLARPYLLEFARLGLSANRALRELGNIKIPRADAAALGIKNPFNLSIRRTDALKMYRDVRDIQESRRYVSAVGGDKTLNPRRFPNLEMDIDRRYRYNVRMVMHNTVTGESQLTNRIIYDDRVLTRNEAGQAAVDMFNVEHGDAVEYMGFNAANWVIDNAMAVQAYHHKGWSY